jgi:hypothetical protein
MKLKILKHLINNNKFSDKRLKDAAEVIKFLSNSELIDEQYQKEILSLASDIYGYLEIKKLMADGMDEAEALNSFSKRVIKIYN